MTKDTINVFVQNNNNLLDITSIIELGSFVLTNDISSLQYEKKSDLNFTIVPDVNDIAFGRILDRGRLILVEYVSDGIKRNIFVGFVEEINILTASGTNRIEVSCSFLTRKLLNYNVLPYLLNDNIIKIDDLMFQIINDINALLPKNNQINNRIFITATTDISTNLINNVAADSISLSVLNLKNNLTELRLYNLIKLLFNIRGITIYTLYGDNIIISYPGSKKTLSIDYNTVIKTTEGGAIPEIYKEYTLITEVDHKTLGTQNSKKSTDLLEVKYQPNLPFYLTIPEIKEYKVSNVNNTIAQTLLERQILMRYLQSISANIILNTLYPDGKTFLNITRGIFIKDAPKDSILSKDIWCIGVLQIRLIANQNVNIAIQMIPKDFASINILEQNLARNLVPNIQTKKTNSKKQIFKK
jgi:hypothetical protein